MNKWSKIVLEIIKGNENIPSPFHKDGVIKSLFVLPDKTKENERIGYLIFWCSVSNKGAVFSRLKIPENVEYVWKEELDNMNLPEIKFQEVSFS